MKFLPILFAALIELVVAFRCYPQTQAISMQQAVSLALANNPEINISTLEVSKARQERTAARGMFLPSINAAAQANHFFELTPFFGFGTYSESDKVPYGRFGGKDQAVGLVYAVQPLFNPVAGPAVRMSKLKEEESKLALSGRQVEIAAKVKQTYLQILVLKQKEKLQKESLRRNQVALNDAKSLLAIGKAVRVDTLRAFTSLKNLEPELQKLSNSVENGKLQLKALTGLSSSVEITLSDSLIMPAEEAIPTEAEVIEAAKTNQSDLRIAALQEKINEHQQKMASAANKPVLSAIGQYQVQTHTNQFNYANAYYPASSFVGLQLSVPLFNGFRNDAKIKQAGLSRQQSASSLKNQHEQLHALAHQVVSNIHESKARLRTTETVRETAQLSYNLTEYRYANGIASRLELTDAEYAFSKAQSNYLEAIYDYLSTRILLNRLMGVIN